MYGFYIICSVLWLSLYCVGEMRMDKKEDLDPMGSPRRLNQHRAIVLRVFKEFADGKSQTAMIQSQ